MSLVLQPSKSVKNMTNLSKMVLGTNCHRHNNRFDQSTYSMVNTIYRNWLFKTLLESLQRNPVVAMIPNTDMATLVVAMIPNTDMATLVVAMIPNTDMATLVSTK